VLTTFDLPAVRRFADDLNIRLAGCNGNGKVCATLDETIKCHFELCSELRDNINRWARAVFAGQAPFDPAVEALFQDEMRRVLLNAEPLLDQGRALCEACYELVWLPALVHHVADLSHLAANWVSPQLAVGPAARVTPGEAAGQQIRERLATLKPLPAAWCPKDPAQAALFGQKPER
jgi:hypothetical protein